MFKKNKKALKMFLSSNLKQNNCKILMDFFVLSKFSPQTRQSCFPTVWVLSRYHGDQCLRLFAVFALLPL